MPLPLPARRVTHGVSAPPTCAIAIHAMTVRVIAASAFAAVTFAVALPAAADAQPLVEQRIPRGAAPGTPAAIADSIAANGDTTRAYAVLDSAIRANPRDAVAWYYNGMWKWLNTGSNMRPGVFPNQKMVRLVAAADSSLRLATRLAPDSARYYVSLGQFTLLSGNAVTRAASRGQVKDGVDAARRSGDKPSLALAADAAGMSDWRRYEALANRAITQDARKITLTGNDNFQRKDALDVVKSFTYLVQPPTGAEPYAAALEYFRTAVEAEPTNLRFSRHLYMALAVGQRWQELLQASSARAQTFPLDYQAQLARGLALHRLQQFANAKTAFDSALALMDDEEAGRLTRFTRILRPKNLDRRSEATDSLQFSSLPKPQQRGLETMYWLMNDPLTLTAENELRLEFLSRVIYADFRWTDEDMNMRGADTDRGDIWVRYGPPKQEMTVSGSSWTSQPDANVTLMWEYPDNLAFFFDLSPSFNTARVALQDKDYVNRVRDLQPANFANVASTRMIDSIAVRIARFRDRGDSTVAVVAARIPLDSLLRGSPLDRVPVDFDFRIFDQFVRVQGMESAQSSFRADSAPGAVTQRWEKTIGPGINVVRVEAMQGDTRRAARGMVRLNPVASAGFAMSDILLGSKPSPRGSDAPKRWRDVEIVPSDGTVARGTSLGLVWELYELTAKEGNGKYRVAISVERTERGGPLGFAVRALDGVGRAVGRTQASRDKFTISFDRTAPAAPSIVEYLSLDMSEATAGRYTLRVEVSDLGSGRKVSRDTEFSIR